MRLTLVGRVAELDLFTAAVDALATGAGGFIHVEGEAGIGKSSLLDALETTAHDRSVRVVRAAADETDGRRRFALARRLVGAAPDPNDDDWFIAAVEQHARNGPLVLLADDLHWADDDSIGALAALARRAEDLGVLLVTATRPHPLPRALRAFDELSRRRGRRIAPTRLDPVGLAQLATTLFGAPPGPRLTAALTTTGGNPFLASELLDALGREGLIRADSAAAELTGAAVVSDDLASRLVRRALLTVPDGELVLRAAATLPGGCSPDELAATLERPVGDVLTACLAAVDAGVLVASGSRLSFRHELLRHAIVHDTPPAIARTLHRRATEVLLADGRDPERVTTLLLEPLGDAIEADRLVAYANEVRRQHPAAAADLLAAALPVSTPGGDADRAVVELGWALVDAGRADEVDALLARWFADRVLPVPAVRLEGVAMSLTGRIDELAERFEDLDLTRIQHDYDVTDPDLLDAAAELAQLRASSGRTREARELLSWLEASSVTPSARLATTVATVRANLLSIEGDFEVAIAQARHAATTATGAGLPPPGTAMLFEALSLDAMGDGDAALRTLRAGQRRAGTARWVPPLLQFAAGLALYRRGAWDDALAEAQAGLNAADEVDLRLGVHWPLAVGALVSCARGQRAAAEQWVARSRSITSSRAVGTEWVVHATAQLHDVAGEPEAAAALYELVVGGLLAAGAPAVLLAVGPDAARLALATGRAALAATVHDELTRLHARSGSAVAAAAAGWVGGLRAGDAAAVEAAAVAFDAVTRPPEAARARHDAAVIAQRAGGTVAARRLAAAAFVAYDALGAEHLHGRLRAELRDAGLAVRPRRAASRPATGWPSLTPTEHAVVELAGGGLTNSEIAERLFVSRRTVESHLGRVYPKLGLRSRPQLVAAVARQRERGESHT